MRDLPILISECERMIRAGDLGEAARLLKSVSMRRVEHRYRLPLARIARRTGEISLGLRLLAGDFDHPKLNRGEVAPSAAEYAVLLLQNGSVGEARSLLQRVRSADHPDVLLAKAWCFFETWDYLEAIAPLRKYTEIQKDPYLAVAGRVNLAEAYIATQAYTKALKLLTPAIQYAQENSHVRLLANGLHLRAQAYSCLGRVVASDEDLSVALEIFGKSRASDALLIRRQIAFNQAQRTKNVKPLHAIRAEAESLLAWESVRECDFQILLLKFDQAIFNRLFFGTPYPAFRMRLQKKFPAAKIPSHYLWGQISNRNLDLKNIPGITRQNQAILEALLQDFYSPLSVGGLFARLFPDEHFDLKVSPTRVHQCLKRFRGWIRDNELPIEIVCKSRVYVLRTTSRFGVKIPSDLRLRPLNPDPIKRLLELFGSSTFSASEAQKILGFSKATVNRYLSRSVSNGALQGLGKGKNVRYRRVLMMSKTGQTSG